MQAKEYDFTSFNEFINKVINPSEMCEQLTDQIGRASCRERV